MDILKRALGTLGFAGPVADVYVDLVEHGRSPARVIAARLGMTRPSVYDQLKILVENGLVVEYDAEGKAQFAVHDIADLGRRMEREEERIALERTELAREQDRLAAHTGTVEPKIRFFAGREAIIGSMHDMLWDDRLTLQVVWPYEEMVRTLGRDELEAFDHKRIRNDIRIETIWTGRSDNEKERLWGEDEPGVERRFAPAQFAPSMGYTIYGDKVLFVSSAQEAFGFTVSSADFASLMREQFAVLWQLSSSSAGAPKKRKRR
jgi:sugar-specific transcriptional regulator TrmB